MRATSSPTFSRNRARMASQMYPRLARALAIICITFPVFCMPVVAFAQTPAEAPQPPELGALRTPASPAFTLLGIEPSAVERPQTPADAAVTVLNNFRNGLPKNFAFEASPYWLQSQPDLTWRADNRRTPAQSLARTTSLSIATSETGTDDAPVTSLAVGFRTLLLSGHLAPASENAMEALEVVLARERAFVQGLMEVHALRALPAEVSGCRAAAAADATGIKAS